MARPRKFYLIYADGLVTDIAHGLDEARHIAKSVGGAAASSAKTRLAAEERMLWHNYQAYQPGGHLHHLTQRARGQ